MEPQNLNELVITFGPSGLTGHRHQRKAAWPLLKATEKAWLLQTAGGELWMPRRRWSDAMASRPLSTPVPPEELHLHVDRARLERLIQLFAEVSSSNRDPRVAVRKVGAGSTGKSVKVEFQVGINDPEILGGPILKKRTATVALSLLAADVDGNCSMPRWALQSKLKLGERGRPGEHLTGTSVWSGLPAVRAQMQAAIDAVAASIADERVRDEEVNRLRRLQDA